MTRDELAGAPDDVARRLLGARLVAGEVVVRLVEVEAYGGASDPASHAFRGPGARNRTMFGPPGHLYVYVSHGIHDCANVVCSPEGVGHGVLLRGAEVLEGLELVEARRGRPVPHGRIDGPGKLCQALSIRRASHDGVDLLDASSPVQLRDGDVRDDEVLLTGPRIGLTKEVARPWRFRLVPSSRRVVRGVAQG